MKKIIVCCFILIFLTGCDVEYNLEFKDGNFKEEIMFILENNEENKASVNELLNGEHYAIFNDNIQKKYEKELITQKNTVRVKFRADYLFEQYRKAMLFNKCYNLYGLQSDDEYYYISTVGSFECMEYDYVPVDDVKIKFSTNHKVKEHNADYIEDNYYIWNINSDNANNKPINIVLDKYDIEKEVKEEVNVSLVLAIIGGIILVIVLGIRLIGISRNRI